MHRPFQLTKSSCPACFLTALRHATTKASSDSSTKTNPPKGTPHQRILHSTDIGKDLPLVEFLSQEQRRDPLSEVFFPDSTTQSLQTTADIPVMLPYRWCVELQRQVREAFNGLEFAHKGLLYRAFIHPTFCGLSTPYTADGLSPIGKRVLRYIYATSLLQSFPDFFADSAVRIEEVVRQLTDPHVIAQTCRDEWKDLGAMVLTDIGISKLKNVFSPKAWSFMSSENMRSAEAGMHFLTRESDPAKFHPELAGLEVDESGERLATATPGRERYYAIPFEETLGFAFVGALYYDKGLPVTMAFVRQYMLKYAVSCMVEKSDPV